MSSSVNDASSSSYSRWTRARLPAVMRPPWSRMRCSASSMSAGGGRACRAGWVMWRLPRRGYEWHAASVETVLRRRCSCHLVALGSAIVSALGFAAIIARGARACDCGLWQRVEAVDLVRERCAARCRHDGRADHVDRREHRRRQGRHPRGGAGGDQLAHVRTGAVAGQGAGRGRRHLRQRSRSGGPDRRRWPRRTRSRRPRSSSSAPRRSRRPSTSTTSRSRRRTASPTRTCGPTHRWPSATPRSSPTSCRSSTRRTPPTTSRTSTRFAAEIDRARHGDAHLVRHGPQARAAHLPRRLRLLRRGVRLEDHRGDPGERLRGPDPAGARRADPAGAGRGCPGDLRLRGVPVAGARPDRQGDRRALRRRAA